jgi:hypothetical protein
MSTLAVVILSLQGMKHLGECLESVRWADLVVVFHGGHREPSVSINSSPSVILRKIVSVKEAKRFSQEIRADWFLHLWGEERVETELTEELRALCRKGVQQAPWAYRIPVRSYLLDRWAEGSLLGPSPALRLSRVTNEIFPGWWDRTKRRVQEAPQLGRGWIGDYSLEQLSDGVDRLQSISELWSEQLQARVQSVSPVTMALYPIRVFMQLLFMNGVFSHGLAGLTLSILAAYATLLGGAKAWEARNVKERNTMEGRVR